MFRQLRTLFAWRALLVHLVRADLQVAYRNKVLGFLWSLLDPLMLMAVYVLLVQVIFKRGEPLFPVLLFSALLAWRWFLYSTQKATMSIATKDRLIQTVAFPRIILPTQHVATGLMKYLFSLGALVPMLLLFRVTFTAQMLWLPVIVFIQLIFTLGFALICSIVGVYFRDLQNILVFTLRIWFYLSPALFSIADRIPPYLRPIYMLNPFSSLFNAYKNILVRGTPPSVYIWVALGFGVAFLGFGLWLFDKMEHRLAKDV